MEHKETPSSRKLNLIETGEMRPSFFYFLTTLDSLISVALPRCASFPAAPPHRRFSPGKLLCPRTKDKRSHRVKDHRNRATSEPLLAANLACRCGIATWGNSVYVKTYIPKAGERLAGGSTAPNKLSLGFLVPSLVSGTNPYVFLFCLVPGET